MVAYIYIYIYIYIYTNGCIFNIRFILFFITLFLLVFRTFQFSSGGKANQEVKFEFCLTPFKY